MGNAISGFPTTSIHAMRSAPQTCHFHLNPWKSPPTPFSHPQRSPRINANVVTFVKIHPHVELNPGDDAPVLLPVVVRNNSSPVARTARYVWDGSTIRLVSFGNGSDGPCRWSSDGAFRFVRGMFVPQHVQANYLVPPVEAIAPGLQLCASSSCYADDAICIGSTQSLPSAAAFNWMLKSGLGRLSRCIYTASIGMGFDTNLKRVRFSTSILFSLSIGVELLTPAFPKYFLLLATIANIARSISLAAYLATGSAIHRSFALTDNLGEVSAKAQFQTVCFGNLGLLLAALLNMSCRNNKSMQSWLPVVTYPFFASLDLFAIYQGLKHVHLHTLTKDRLEIIIDTWILSGYVASPAEVSDKEDINFISVKGSQMMPIRIGCIKSKISLPTITKLTLQSLSNEEKYFICLEMPWSGFARRKACRIRKSLALVTTRWDCVSDVREGESSLMYHWFRRTGSFCSRACIGVVGP